MDIRPTQANKISGIYRQNMSPAGVKSADSSRQAANKDSIAISEEGMRQSEFGKTIRTLASEVFRDAPAERLNTLRAAIENGTYSVSSKLIAESILARISA